MSDEDKSKDLEFLKEFLDRKVPTAEAVVSALILVPLLIGSTIFLRSHFAWPPRDIPAAGILAVKDFLPVSTIVSASEVRWKQMRHPIRYGIAGGSIVSFVTFVYWAFLS